MVSDIPDSSGVQSGWAAPVATCVMAELVLLTVLLVRVAGGCVWV